ncbi:MAG: hypothetical protein JWO06_318 [Bacteroidota bacterium]|nr:hypothetical protein [Bacteroidota bacterium]
MKQLVALLLFISITSSAWSQQKSYYPSPVGFINDFEGDLTKEENAALDKAVKDLLIQAMDRQVYKGMEIAIVTVTDSMYGDEKDIKDYAVKMANKWGVGDKSDNTGILIAVSRKLHKVYLATGTGMEKLLPNDSCQKIIDERMLPELRRGRYYDALLAALGGIKESLGIK